MCYFEHIGRIEGEIVRHTGDGFRHHDQRDTPQARQARFAVDMASPTVTISAFPKTAVTSVLFPL